jgi:ankyrin repeat protein
MSPQLAAITRHKQRALAKLLVAGSSCELAAVRRYLAAGGTPNAVVKLHLCDKRTHDGELVAGPEGNVPLLLTAVINHHGEHAGSLELLLNAGARVDSIGHRADGSDCTALMWAAERPCCDEPLKLLLQRGANPCWQSRCDGIAALHLAANYGHIEKCKLLLEASSGRALNIAAADGRTPLWLAANRGHLGVVQLLQQHGADLTALVDSETLLHCVARSESTACLPVLEYLLSAGLEVNAVQKEGITALGLAAYLGNLELVQVLLERGADPNIVDKIEGYTILHRLTEQSSPSSNSLPELECLLNSGRVDVNAISGFANMTALHFAVVHKRTEVVQLLLEHGADPHIPNAVAGVGGLVPLLSATAAGHTAVVELLLNHNAAAVPVRGTAQYRRELQLLMHAVGQEQADIVALLLARGIDVDAADQSGWSALHYAIGRDHKTVKVVKLLLQSGADPNKLPAVTAEDTAAPLRAAVCRGDAAVVQLLIAAGADIDNLFEECSTPLLMAADKPAVVKLLLAAGADVHCTALNGDTCLHVAAARGYCAPVLCLLIKAGVDLHAVNSAGKTAAQVAHDAGHTLAQQLLNRAALDA